MTDILHNLICVLSKIFMEATLNTVIREKKTVKIYVSREIVSPKLRIIKVNKDFILYICINFSCVLKTNFEYSKLIIKRIR